MNEGLESLRRKLLVIELDDGEWTYRKGTPRHDIDSEEKGEEQLRHRRSPRVIDHTGAQKVR